MNIPQLGRGLLIHAIPMASLLEDCRCIFVIACTGFSVGATQLITWLETAVFQYGARIRQLDFFKTLAASTVAPSS